MRLIDADVLVNTMTKRFKRLEAENGPYDHYTVGFDDAISYVVVAPTIDAKIVGHSHWVNCEGHTFAPVGSRCYCNNCHFYDSAPYNWCHGCGAKMDGGSEDE